MDIEADGQPTVSAKGDDLAGTDDEDGVTFLTTLLTSGTASHTSSVLVQATASGRLDGWLDFNRDGVFDDLSEAILDNVGVASGANVLSYTLPAGAATGLTYARFRISSTGNLPPTGLATNGEVEDYAVTLVADTSPATVSLPPGGGGYEVRVSGTNIQVLRGTTVLFATPQNTISSLTIQGTTTPRDGDSEPGHGRCDPERRIDL